MRLRLLLSIVLFLAATGSCIAGEYNAGLTVSNTTLIGTVGYKKQMMNGYWRVAGSGVYSDTSDREYKWLELDFMVGNDLMHPGLICEAGLKGVLGDAAAGIYSGDVGALAFSGKIGYLLPTVITFIPVSIYADLSYSPEILAFRDNENYLSYGLGVDIQIVDNAFIVVGYRVYDIKMESGSTNWTLDDNQFQFGLRFGF